MGIIQKAHIEELAVSSKREHEDYCYDRRKFVPFGTANHSVVSVYEVPPGKAAYPYHYHMKNEETFYILSGKGILRTPDGERPVAAGELLFFPAGPEGAHKLTNASENGKLVYIDFDAVQDLDVTIYPDSEKIGVWGMGINRVFPQSGAVDYYTGEG